MAVQTFSLIFSIVVVGIIGVLVSRVWHRSRVARLEAWAVGRGWTYTEFDDSLAEHYAWAPFRSWGVYVHVVRGEHRGRRFTAFEHGYGEPGAGPPTSHAYRVVAVAAPEAGGTQPPVPRTSPVRVGGELVGWEGRSLTPEACLRMLDQLNDTAELSTAGDEPGD